MGLGKKPGRLFEHDASSKQRKGEDKCEEDIVCRVWKIGLIEEHRTSFPTCPGLNNTLNKTETPQERVGQGVRNTEWED